MPPHPNNPSPHPKRNRRQRSQAIKDAVRAHGPGRITIPTPDGTVFMEAVMVTADDIIEVQVAEPENGDPTFRVINPPRYIPDPSGDIEINGTRFRDDPLAALAHVVAQHGGRMKDPRRGVQ